MEDVKNEEKWEVVPEQRGYADRSRRA